jgi:hypothetical protein
MHNQTLFRVTIDGLPSDLSNIRPHRY